MGNMSKPGYLGSSLTNLDTKDFAQIIRLVSSGTISSRGAKDTITIWLTSGGNPEDIAKENGLRQISDIGDLTNIIKDILVAHETVVVEYKAGKEQALQFLVGQCMKVTKGAANPKTLQEILTKEILG